MRNKFWEEKNAVASRPSRSKSGSKGIDVTKLSASQIEALKAALIGE